MMRLSGLLCILGLLDSAELQEAHRQNQLLRQRLADAEAALSAFQQEPPMWYTVPSGARIPIPKHLQDTVRLPVPPGSSAPRDADGPGGMYIYESEDICFISQLNDELVREYPHDLVAIDAPTESRSDLGTVCYRSDLSVVFVELIKFLSCFRVDASIKHRRAKLTSTKLYGWLGTIISSMASHTDTRSVYPLVHQQIMRLYLNHANQRIFISVMLDVAARAGQGMPTVLQPVSKTISWDEVAVIFKFYHITFRHFIEMMSKHMLDKYRRVVPEMQCQHLQQDVQELQNHLNQCLDGTVCALWSFIGVVDTNQSQEITNEAHRLRAWKKLNRLRYLAHDWLVTITAVDIAHTIGSWRTERNSTGKAAHISKVGASWCGRKWKLFEGILHPVLSQKFSNTTVTSRQLNVRCLSL